MSEACSGIDVLIAASTGGRHVYLPALRSVPGIAQVTRIDDVAGLPRYAEVIKPDLVIASLDGVPSEWLRLLHRLRDPRLIQCDIIAVVRSVDQTLTKSFERLDVQPCVASATDTSAVVQAVTSVLRRRVPGEIPQPGQEGVPPTERVVANALKRVDTPLSADEVAARCGFSTVTVRRYLERLVNRGTVAVGLHYRAVGRPARLYRWITRTCM
nr:hypothetical protein [Kibdelosporangium sp. MJ126-NF4]CTQ98929.1 hypothetical protein [Kibdelosporangium sp. MJ126-NF4]